MIQNLWQKFQSFFKKNENKRPLITEIIDETPYKKLKFDDDIFDEMNKENNKLPSSYMSRNVTLRNDKPKNLVFSFDNKREDNTFNFLKSYDTVYLLDEYKFEGSSNNNRYESTPKPTSNYYFGDKMKFKTKNKTNISIKQSLRLKEKSEYENLVQKYCFNLNSNPFLTSLIKPQNCIQSSSTIIIDDDDDSKNFSNHSSTDQSIKLRNKIVDVGSCSNPIIINDIMEKPTKVEKPVYIDKFNPYLSHHSLRQSINIDPFLNKCNDTNKSKVINFSNILANKSEAENYLDKIKSRLERNTKNLNEIFSKELTISNAYSDRNESHFKINNEKNVINLIDDEVLPKYKSTSVHKSSEDRSNRNKEIDDFNNALNASPFCNEHYISNLCSTRCKREINEAIIKNEVEINFYKNLRQKDDKNLINQINNILHISKRITPPIDESAFYVEEDEEDDLMLIKVEQDKDSFPPLTAEQDQLVANIFNMDGSEKVAVEAFRLQITYKDLSTLASLNWLNDEIINFYMNLIVERNRSELYCFNTFFYPKIASDGQKSVRRWTKNVDIFSFSIILVPVHLGVHWCMAIIDFSKKEIQYYDSLGGNHIDCVNALQNYLCDEHKDKKGKDFDTNGWQKLIVKDIPHQQNGSDCGVFACKFAEYISKRATINFDQSHMPYFRKRMVLEIVEKRLWS